MTKLQILNQIKTDIAEQIKLSKSNEVTLHAILDTHLKAKLSSATQEIIYDEDTGLIKEAYCRYHNRYEDAEDLVIDNRTDVTTQKSRNRCKAGTHMMKLYKAQIKTAQKEAQEALLAGDIDTATTKATEAKTLTEQIKDYSIFNYDEDQATFKEFSEPVKPKRGSKNNDN